MKNVLKCKKGQSLVELAISLPLLLVLAVIVTDLANLIFLQLKLQAAVREGARVATETVGTPSEILTKISDRTKAVLLDSKAIKPTDDINGLITPSFEQATETIQVNPQMQMHTIYYFYGVTVQKQPDLLFWNNIFNLFGAQIPTLRASAQGYGGRLGQVEAIPEAVG